MTGLAVAIAITHPVVTVLWIILGMTVFYSVKGHTMGWIKRRPLRRRHRFGPWTVNTSDARITSTTLTIGPLHRGPDGRWKIKLPFGFYIPLGQRK